jgi:hypothetical protein
MSTSFLVIQAQRDLAQARMNELLATLAYDTALIDFDAIQQAPPAQGGAAENSTGGTIANSPGSAPSAPRVMPTSTGASQNPTGSSNPTAIPFQ